ncbi:MAG: hypothetical protein ACOY93_09330 [Bacillota bacterium]
MRAEVEERADGLLELRLVWHWDDPLSLELGPRREELLAVSFDTRELLFESEEASYGVGVNGESLSLLQQVAGFNGARRFFVVPQGRDGRARVVLRPTRREGGSHGLIQIHAVVDPDQGEAAVRELLVATPELLRAGSGPTNSET